MAEPALGREAQVAPATETLADDFRGSETIYDLDFRGHTGSRGKIRPHHWWMGLVMHHLDEGRAECLSEDTGFPFGNVHKVLELKQDRVDHALERPRASGKRCRSFKCQVSEMLVGNEPRSEVLGNSPDQTPTSHAECRQRDRGFGALHLRRLPTA